MPADPRLEAFLNARRQAAGKPAGVFQRAAAVVATLVVFALALTFSVVVFAAIATLGLVVWGWFWWKTRELRRVLREQAASGAQAGRRPADGRHPPEGGMVIEGEVIREIVTERDDPRPH